MSTVTIARIQTQLSELESQVAALQSNVEYAFSYYTFSGRTTGSPRGARDARTSG